MKKAVLALLLLTSCQNQPVVPEEWFAVIDDSALIYKDSIQAVLGEYEAQSETLLFRSEGTPNPGQKIVHFATTSEGWGPEGGTARYNETDDGKVVNLYKGIRPTWAHLPISIAHELGHVLGLCHSKDKFNVMYTSSQNVEDLQLAVSQILYDVNRGGNCNDP